MRFKLVSLATTLLLTNAKKSWVTDYLIDSIPLDLSDPDKDTFLHKLNEFSQRYPDIFMEKELVNHDNFFTNQHLPSEFDPSVLNEKSYKGHPFVN